MAQFYKKGMRILYRGVIKGLDTAISQYSGISYGYALIAGAYWLLTSAEPTSRCGKCSESHCLGNFYTVVVDLQIYWYMNS